MVPRRLQRLPRCGEVFVAVGPRARLLGLAGLSSGAPLLIPRCRSVHTFGMRFSVDLHFLAADGQVLDVARAVPPGRIVTRRGASAVLEVPCRFPRMEAHGQLPSAERMTAALDPRRRIYRDPFNEYLLFVLSAGGAVAGTQVPLYIVMAIAGELWDWWVFVGACVIFELAVIFGIARPAMKPIEAVGWTLLWTFTTAVLALAFFYLVADPTL